MISSQIIFRYINEDIGEYWQLTLARECQCMANRDVNKLLTENKGSPMEPLSWK